MDKKNLKPGPKNGTIFWSRKRDHFQADEKKCLLKDFVVRFSGPLNGPENGTTSGKKNVPKTKQFLYEIRLRIPPKKYLIFKSAI